MPRNVSEASTAYRALADAALAIGRRRAKLLDEMRTALLEDNTEHAIDIARRLTGLEEDDEEEGDCATSRIN